LILQYTPKKGNETTDCDFMPICAEKAELLIKKISGLDL